jgi:aspartyl-tRNA(Asn)/glutamyl-tRNA(Gln) amidotransferase subunit C
MSINIEHLLKLARLKLEPTQAADLEKDLEGILRYVIQLASSDTSGAEPMTGGTELTNIMRADEERTDSFKEEGLLLNAAPETEKKYFKTPRVLE